MNRIDPKKLFNSKWTAVQPRNREKHFLVTAVHCDAAGHARTCILESVLTRRGIALDWRELRNPDHWQMGWQK